MPIEHLTELQYSQDREGPWGLYVYEPKSDYHCGATWFRAKPVYPDEEITTTEAERRTKQAVAEGREVRIVDKGDMLVFHAKDFKVLYGESFWTEIGKVA